MENSIVVESGEGVYYLPRNWVEAPRHKMEPRLLAADGVCACPSSSAYRGVCDNGLVLVRTLARQALEERWNAKAVFDVTVTAWQTRKTERIPLMPAWSVGQKPSRKLENAQNRRGKLADWA